MARRATYQYASVVAVSGGGITVVTLDAVPDDRVDEIQAADVVHNGANPTDLAIGVISPTNEVVLFVSSATDAARPSAGVPVTLRFPNVVPPGWRLIGAASNLIGGETITIRALWRRV